MNYARGACEWAIYEGAADAKALIAQDLDGRSHLPISTSLAFGYRTSHQMELAEDRRRAGMRLKDVVYSMPFLALGFAGWRHADWVVSSANSGVDGTCAGIEELLSRGLAIAFWLLSVAVFLFGILFRSLKRFLEDEGPSCGGSVFGECDPDRI